MKKLMSAIFVFFITQPLFAQAGKECANMPIDTAALVKAESYAIARGPEVAPEAVSRLIKVYFHVCRNDGGTTAAATAEEIEQEFNMMVSKYAANGLCFANMGTNFINNTEINYNLDPDVSADVDLLNPFLIPGCLNIFIHQELAGYRGNAYGIPNIFCSIARSGLGAPKSMTHEVGHCLGLSHTHAGCGSTYISGTNCSTTGDRVCDTPADPYCFEDENCFSTSATSCSYLGSCADAGGQDNWSPPYNNIMSYWYNYGCTRISFTNGQFARANSFIDTYAPLVQSLSPATVSYSSVSANSGFQLRAAINSIATGAGVNLTGSVVAGFVSPSVSVMPGMNAAPGSGEIIFRASGCN